MGGKFSYRPFAWGVSASALTFVSLIVLAGASGAAAPDSTKIELEQRFTDTVRPILKTYCVSCHGKQKPAAQLDLTAYANMASVVQDYGHWTLVMEKLSSKQMPPANFPAQPSAKQRDSVITWVRAVRTYEANRNAGDPGAVPAHRLSNAEYDYTIRDLTGQDLHPTKEFPVDPANQEGFDNSGESLTLSAGLVKKYVKAAKEISDHVVLTSTGLAFASHPVLVDTDRDKFCILRIVDYYKSQPTDFADYFQAAWHFKYRAALGAPDATLQAVAAGSKVSPNYLALVWKTLIAPQDKGPVAKLQSMWNALPAPDKGNPDTAHAGCIAMRDWVVGLRKKVACKFPNLRVPGGFSTGGQVFVLWKDREYASHRRALNPAPLQIDGVPHSKVIPAHKEGNREVPQRTETEPVDPDLFVPKDEVAARPYMAGFNEFCSVFPDAFYISERGRMYDDSNDKGRLLTAGLHNSLGYFRDDTPLMELILDDNGRKELDNLWLDFDMVAFVPERMHREFFHYERAEAGTTTGPEFDFVRAEDKDATSDEKIKKYGELYMAKAIKNGGYEPDAIKAIDYHFKWVASRIRATERARLASEPVQLKSLVDFARRAYRRPLTTTERNSILAFYQSLRQKEGLTHEDAIRDSVASILLSPKFLFRVDLESTASASETTAGGLSLASLHRPPAPPTTAGGLQPLSDYALASRLSYFLWSSMPDDELLKHAAAGDLHKPEVLAAQARRMLKDPRVRALALEFTGNWLDFRRFEEHNAVDRNRFPTFTDDLREAMFEEPVHFLVDEFQNDRSVLDMVFAKHTFVNATLAKHYGMKDVKPSGNDWVCVKNADMYGRGGILPMAVFLTANSPGLRTSPVKRGYWVVKRVLGEYIPPPPATVPALPSDETKMGDLTLRQALEKHRSNPACASCHARFDSYGIVFEGYGPIGEMRNTDLGGKTVDPKAPFPGGQECTGVTGLRDFIRQKRRQDFLDTISRKLLSYSLGRTLQPSDDPLLAQMQKRLAAQDYRFGTLVETIVTSRQFRFRRSLANIASK